MSPPAWIQGTWEATEGSRTWTFTAGNAVGSAEGDLKKVAADGNREGNASGVSVRLSDSSTDTRYEASVRMASRELGSTTQKYVVQKTGEKTLDFSWYSDETLKSGPDSFAKP